MERSEAFRGQIISPTRGVTRGHDGFAPPIWTANAQKGLIDGSDKEQNVHKAKKASDDIAPFPPPGIQERQIKRSMISSPGDHSNLFHLQDPNKIVGCGFPHCSGGN